MELNELEKLYSSCMTNPNYQFKDSSQESILELATISFNKLTDAQKDKVKKSWALALAKEKKELTAQSVESMLKYRFMAQTNLFFLCHLLETYNQTVVTTHEEICNKFFVQKNPTFLSFRQFADQYSEKKDRMLLVPRGGFKSSIDIADCVQWVISFPAITILILTGVYSLAGDFLGELKSHFTLEDSNAIDPKTGKLQTSPKQFFNEATSKWSSSMFQVLFPEHCIPQNSGTQFEYDSPAGGHEKEATVSAASIEQALAGKHFGVMKLDDVITNENSQTVERLQKVSKQISIDRAMLHPYGFMDVIGTWYDEKDFYGQKIKQEEAFAKEEGMIGAIKGSVDSGRFESNVNYKIYLRSALWLTPEAIAAGKTDVDAVATDYELWFPERLPFSFLASERKTDPDGFPIKYLNNPRKLNKVKFPRELLMKRTIPATQLPPNGVIVTTIDTAYSTKSWADYTVILTTFISGGRFYIVNMKRGKYNEYELPQIIANTANVWKPKRIAIEDSVGVKWMGKELRREMDKLQISIPVEYISLGLGSKANSKAMKAKPVLRLLGDERMYFLNSCEGLNELYNELEAFTGTSDDAHDDIVSALSILADQFGSFADSGPRMDVVNSNYVSDQQNFERHQMIYGLGKYSSFNASQQLANEDNPKTVFQIEQGRLFRDEVDIDPLAQLF